MLSYQPPATILYVGSVILSMVKIKKSKLEWKLVVIEILFYKRRLMDSGDKVGNGSKI